MANRLAQEKSPYLLQHADNPVDWFPWSDEAFAKAQAEDKPVFLSVGYATCHWCHVMAHESFEDQGIAERLNRDFVAIKVDREERPDLDQIYMTVCQAMTGHGGWPLSVFLTPERRPFFAGTYFPKTDRSGLPGFDSVLEQIAKLWKNQRHRVLDQSAKVTAAIQPRPAPSQATPELDQGVLAEAFHRLRAVYDSTWGGFGTAPKFPTPHQLTFLLRWYRRSGDHQALAMVEKTLGAMRRGGIFDQIGFGFHRYSVDQQWLVPHFEKMLYDQAMLAMAYTEAFQLTGKAFYATVVREIFSYVDRNLRHPLGGFYCAEDADSEGREGLFYLWTPDQVRDVLGPEPADLYCRYYDISALGNFEHGFSIPHITKAPEVFAGLNSIELPELAERLETARKRLFAARSGRVRPLLDDKVLASWNGLMIAALAKGYQALGDPAQLRAAERAADFVLEHLRPDGRRLRRRWRDGQTAHLGFLDDYAFMIWGLLELHQAGFDPRRLEQALELQNEMLELFHDPDGGGFHYSGRDGEALIVRDKEIHDSAIPASNSVALENLLRLGRLTGEPRWEELAAQGLKTFAELVRGYPMAYTQLLQALDFALGPTREWVVAAPAADPEGEAMLRLIQTRFDPGKTVHRLTCDRTAEERLISLAPHLAALNSGADGARVYLCEGCRCREPLSSLAELRRVLDAEAPGLSPQPEDE